QAPGGAVRRVWGGELPEQPRVGLPGCSGVQLGWALRILGWVHSPYDVVGARVVAPRCGLGPGELRVRACRRSHVLAAGPWGIFAAGPVGFEHGTRHVRPLRSAHGRETTAPGARHVSTGAVFHR